ncbi:MAG: hypothetical protein LBG70_00650, partial [Bifidobacteriaceae bacterium]|nr:hypothetical protein [Bifidobacteriaceae bacterium]
MSASPRLTVLVSAPGDFRQVINLLADMSASRLLEPFVWIEAAEQQLSHFFIKDGLVTPLPVAEAIEQLNPELLRLAVAHPLNSSAPPVGTSTIAAVEAAISATGITPAHRLRVLWAIPGLPATLDPSLLRSGWHNLLISPHDVSSPSKPNRLAWEAGDSQILMASRVAAALSGLLGLWRGGQAPLDNTDADQAAGLLRLAVTQHRHIDAATVAGQLQQVLFDFSEG